MTSKAHKNPHLHNFVCCCDMLNNIYKDSDNPQIIDENSNNIKDKDASAIIENNKKDNDVVDSGKNSDYLEKYAEDFLPEEISISDINFDIINSYNLSEIKGNYTYFLNKKRNIYHEHNHDDSNEEEYDEDEEGEE